MRKLLIALFVLCGIASTADAGQWVLIDYPTYAHRDSSYCTITYYKGGWFTTVPDIPCILQKTAYGIRDGADNIGGHLHNRLCPCSNDYILRPRPSWTRYSIFHTRRWRNRVTN